MNVVYALTHWDGRDVLGFPLLHISTATYERNTGSVSLGIYRVPEETHQSFVGLMTLCVPVEVSGTPDVRCGS